MYVPEKIYFFWIIIYFHISAFIRTGNDSLLFVSYFGKETKKVSVPMMFQNYTHVAILIFCKEPTISHFKGQFFILRINQFHISLTLSHCCI